MIHKIRFQFKSKQNFKRDSKVDRRTAYLRQYYRWKRDPDFEIINVKTKSLLFYFLYD